MAFHLQVKKYLDKTALHNVTDHNNELLLSEEIIGKIMSFYTINALLT